MKNKLGWVLAAIPLIAIALFYVFKSEEYKKKPRRDNPSIAGKSILSLKDKPSPKDALDQQKHLDELHNQSLAKGAQLTTPDLQRRLLDASMQTREPRYREFFQRWKVDSKTTDLALEVVRDREKQTMEYLQQYRQKGVASVKEFAGDIRVEKDNAAIMLETLLGKDVYNRFSSLEADVESDMRKKAASPFSD